MDTLLYHPPLTEARLSTMFTGEEELDRSSFVTWETFLMLRLGSWLIDKPLLPDRLCFTFPIPPDRADPRRLPPGGHAIIPRQPDGAFK